MQGIVASTLDIKNSDFLTGQLRVPEGHGRRPMPCVVNQGSINAHNGGYVVLAGDYRRTTGIIQAQFAAMWCLAAGSRTTLTLSGNSWSTSP